MQKGGAIRLLFVAHIPSSIFRIIVSMKERILQKHFLKRSLIPYGKTSMRKLVVAFLMHDSIDDVEEHFLVWLNRFRTNGATQAADDLEHILFSLQVNTHWINTSLNYAHCLFYPWC